MQSLGILESTAAAVAKEPASPVELQLVLAVPSFWQSRWHFPEQAFLLSCLLHAVIIAALPWLAPSLRLSVTYTASMPLVTQLAPDEHLYLPDLGDSGTLPGSSPKSGAEGKAGAGKSAIAPPLPAKFVGRQRIVSDPPDATNELQTIRRPDLVAPMKIKKPVPLPSMVQIPTPAIKLKAAVPEWLSHPAPTAIPVKAEITSNAPAPTKEPVLVVRKSEAAPKVIDTPPPSVMPDAKQSAPALTPLAGNAPALAKAAVVVNAIEVSAAPNANIPDAELSGRFSVSALSAEVKAPSAAGVPGGTGSGASTAGEHGGASSGEGSGSAPAGTGSASSGRETGTGSGTGGSGTDSHAGGGRGTGSGNAAGAGAGSGNGTRVGNGGRGSGGVGSGRGAGLNGISIAGGSGSGSGGGGGIHIASSSRSYNMTIIAAGSNGGASRDLGIFGPGETVYTVYLSMRDAGGGPDWSMQYAAPGTGGAVLTPPFPKTKVSAKTSADNHHEAGAVFIAGDIDTDGNLISLHPARPSDTRSAAAMAVLAQWQFTPAQIDQKPVPVKVLIGVQFVSDPVAGKASQ